jgi:hypothetical protein
MHKAYRHLTTWKKLHEQDARVVESRECRQELLCGECREQKQDGGD